MDMSQFQEQVAAIMSTPGLVKNLVMSLTALVTLLILRAIFNKNVQLWRVSLDTRRRLVVAARNLSVVVFVLINVFIWGSQIKEFAFSVAAIAVAFVMVFKEMIANFMGGISRSISHEYSIGDRIQVGTFRGDVIDTDMLTTTILEIGPGLSSHQYTGSSIVFPNTLLMTTPVINESFMQDYLLHVFKVPVRTDEDWRHKEKCLLRAAKIIVEPYLNKARISIETMAHKISVDAPSADPRVSLVFSSPDTMDLIVRVPVPIKRKGKVEQEIIRLYLEFLEAPGELAEKEAE